MLDLLEPQDPQLAIAPLALASISSAEKHGTSHAQLTYFLVDLVDMPLLLILLESDTAQYIEVLACL